MADEQMLDNCTKDMQRELDQAIYTEIDYAQNYRELREAVDYLLLSENLDLKFLLNYTFKKIIEKHDNQFKNQSNIDNERKVALLDGK